MSCIFRTAALRPFLSLVLAILTAYYYALKTKLVTTLKSFQAAACEIIFWETWGQQGKVRSKHISVDSKIDQFLSFHKPASPILTYPFQILRRIPGPQSIPVIGAQWLYFPLLGKYKYSKYHEANDEKLEKYGTVVREEVIWNFPLIHLFDSKVSE